MTDVLERAQAVERLLADENVQEAIAALKRQNYDLFIRSKDESGRAMAQAQAIVLESFEATLRGVVGAGERERLEQERRDRAPDTSRAP